MATPPPVTDRLARFVNDTDMSTMSGKTLANAKLHILDTLGVALAGVVHRGSGDRARLLPRTRRS